MGIGVLEDSFLSAFYRYEVEDSSSGRVASIYPKDSFDELSSSVLRLKSVLNFKESVYLPKGFLTSGKAGCFLLRNCRMNQSSKSGV